MSEELKETQITVHTISKKGNNYYNIYPKKELKLGEYITGKKLYAEGRQVTGQFGTVYSVTVELKDGVIASFLLNEKEHSEFMGCGGEGDWLKIIPFENRVTNPKNNSVTLYVNLKFEKI